MNTKLYVDIIMLTLILLIALCCIYAINSGSCQIDKKYICNNKFCLFKEFNVNIPDKLHENINLLLSNNEIKKRVTIKMYPETIFNCALPNKNGITISTNNIIKYMPELIDYYQNELCDIVSKKINLKLYPTELEFPTSCAILIYEKQGDWINWHYDYNYYDGRFFTVLIPITNELTCTQFEYKDNNNKVKSINLINNNSVCFEGNYLYHRASKLCKNQKRIILSCQYVTNNNMSIMNKLRIKIKDFAYIGKLL